MSQPLSQPTNRLVPLNPAAIFMCRLAAGMVLVVCSAMTVVHLNGAPADPARAAANALMAALGALTLVLFRFGWYRTGFIGMVSGGWISVTGLILVSGGLYSTNLITYPMLILISGIFLGSRASWTISLLSVLAIISFGWLHQHGFVPPPSPKSIWVPVVAVTTSILISALGTWIFNRSLADRLSQLTEALKHQEQAEQELKESHRKVELLNAELEIRVEQRTKALQDEISERQRVEAESRRIAESLSTIIETIDSGILVWSVDRKLMKWNSAFASIFPQVAPFLKHEMLRDDMGVLMRAHGELIGMDQEASRWEALGRFEASLPNGQLLEITRLAMPDGGRLVMHTDVTELRRSRQIMARNERLAALGGLVAGVSHEINTPLGNALMVGSTLKDLTTEFEALRSVGPIKKAAFERYVGKVLDSADQIMRNLQRAAELIQHFKQMAVDQTSDRRRRFKLAETLKDIQATLINRLRKEGHQLTISCPNDIQLDGFPGTIGQMVTILVENAIVHAFQPEQPGQMTLACRLEGDQISMVFADNGTGIAPEHQSRIFDPFFTTRLGQGGSGLGLAILANLTQDVLGGSVTLHSMPGRGAQFAMTFPLTAPQNTSGQTST